VTYFEPMAVDDRLWPIARATVATRHGNSRSKSRRAGREA
jgi:hypothetical protein